MYLLYYLTGKTGRITYTVPENEFRTPRKQALLKCILSIDYVYTFKVMLYSLLIKKHLVLDRYFH